MELSGCTKIWKDLEQAKCWSGIFLGFLNLFNRAGRKLRPNHQVNWLIQLAGLKKHLQNTQGGSFFVPDPLLGQKKCPTLALVLGHHLSVVSALWWKQEQPRDKNLLSIPSSKSLWQKQRNLSTEVCWWQASPKWNSLHRNGLFSLDATILTIFELGSQWDRTSNHFHTLECQAIPS